ncbi:MAG TPA: M48 family metallopeptidase [Terriglobales bacterium]|nr:M48 family metallopeptidase [Terriglobales bacterium]
MIRYRAEIRALAICLCLLLAAPDLMYARFQPTSGSDMFTVQQEIQAGQQAAAQTSRQMPILPDSSPITQYVQRLGEKLTSYAPGERWPYNFHVVDQKDINAFALPGGPIYVNLGTIQVADNEAQLAGVMSHEISHVVQRHATRAATKQYKAQVGLGILGALLGGSLGGQLAAAGISFAAGSYFLKNSRESEKEADLLGTDIMYDAGYDPTQLPKFFEKIAEEGNQGVQFLSDHPNPGNRIGYVDQEIATLPPKSNFKEDSPEFDKIKRLALSMHPYTAQQIAEQDKQGGFDPSGVNAGSSGEHSREQQDQYGNEPSNASFRQLNHSIYTISYPANWTVYGDSQSAVTIAPPDGLQQGANGENSVAIGVIIDRFEPEQSESADQAMHDLIASLREANPDLREVGNDEGIRVNGVAGRSADLIGTSPIRGSNGKPESERDWLVSIQRQDGTLLYLVFIAPEKQFDQLRPTYEQMLRTVELK